MEYTKIIKNAYRIKQNILIPEMLFRDGGCRQEAGKMSRWFHTPQKRPFTGLFCGEFLLEIPVNI